jgi:hypothetical protein
MAVAYRTNMPVCAWAAGAHEVFAIEDSTMFPFQNGDRRVRTAVLRTVPPVVRVASHAH